MQLIGIMIIVNGLIFSGYLMVTQQNHSVSKAFALAALSIFVGAFILLRDRITEITVKGVGSIKAAVKQVEVDAAQVQEIKQNVEAQSHTINLIAKEVSEARSRVEEIAGKSKEVENLISDLKAAQIKFGNSLEELESINSFMMTFVRAQNDDREAYDELAKLAEDKSYKFASFASRAYQTIMDSHSAPFYMSGLTVPWKEGVDPNKLSLEVLTSTFRGSPAHFRAGILEFISNRKDIEKKDKMQFYIDVIRNEKSLSVVEYAGRFFAAAADLKIKPLATPYFLDWWEKNRNSIKE